MRFKCYHRGLRCSLKRWVLCRLQTRVHSIRAEPKMSRALAKICNHRVLRVTAESCRGRGEQRLCQSEGFDLVMEAGRSSSPCRLEPVLNLNRVRSAKGTQCHRDYIFVIHCTVNEIPCEGKNHKPFAAIFQAYRGECLIIKR